MEAFNDNLPLNGEVWVHWKDSKSKPSKGIYKGFDGSNPRRCCVELAGQNAWIDRAIISTKRPFNWFETNVLGAGSDLHYEIHNAWKNYRAAMQYTMSVFFGLGVVFAALLFRLAMALGK